jgi:hypothetical protein
MKSVAGVSVVVVSLFAVLLAGCGSSASPGSGSGGPSAPLASGGASTVYVVEDPAAIGLPAEVLEFPANSKGTVPPSAILYPPSTMTVATAVATDSTGGIYVGGSTSTAGSYEICVYAAGSAGAATPARTITETSVQPTGMAIDSAGLLYATGPTANVAVFSATASGTATPVNVIAGALTQLVQPNAIAVDAAKNVYVTNIASSGVTGTILVFASGATGNVAPNRVISPGANLSFFYGVALDASGNVYATAAQDNGAGINSPAIVEYAGGVGGSATPTKTITSSGALTNGYDIAVDGVGNMYVVNGPGASQLTVLGFGPSATGSVAPGVDFNSGIWNYGGVQIAVH